MRHAGFVVMLLGSAGIALASIHGKTGEAEPVLWLALSLAGAVTFVRTRENPLRYAFPATAAAALVAPVLQWALFPVLLAHNPAVQAQIRSVPGGMSPRGFILALAPLVAIAFAGVTSLLTIVVRRMVGRAPA